MNIRDDASTTLLKLLYEVDPHIAPSIAAANLSVNTLARLVSYVEEAVTAPSLRRERDDWQRLAIDLGARGRTEEIVHRDELTLTMRVDAGLLRLGGLAALVPTFQKMHDEYAKWLAANRTDTPPPRCCGQPDTCERDCPPFAALPSSPPAQDAE